jgi:hypothetical protein
MIWAMGHLHTRRSENLKSHVPPYAITSNMQFTSFPSDQNNTSKHSVLKYLQCIVFPEIIRP